MSKPFALFLAQGIDRLITKPSRHQRVALRNSAPMSCFLPLAPQNRTTTGHAADPDSNLVWLPLALEHPDEINNRLYWREKCSILVWK
jgi:hypothetical protein